MPPVRCSAWTHILLLVTSANDFKPKHFLQQKKKKKASKKGSLLFLFSIYCISPGSCGAAANNLLPCNNKKKKRKNSIGLKENLASSKVMLCWTFIVFGRREKQGQRSIKEVSVPFVTSSAGHFSCMAFLLWFFFFFFTLSEKVEQQKKWRVDFFSFLKTLLKKTGNISVPLLLWTLFIDLNFFTLKPLTKKGSFKNLSLF